MAPNKTLQSTIHTGCFPNRNALYSLRCRTRRKRIFGPFTILADALTKDALDFLFYTRLAVEVASPYSQILLYSLGLARSGDFAGLRDCKQLEGRMLDCSREGTTARMLTDPRRPAFIDRMRPAHSCDLLARHAPTPLPTPLTIDYEGF